MGCKGRCENEYKGTHAGYIEGKKRCTVCEIYLKTTDTRCYCCNNRLRTKPQCGLHRKKRLETVVRI